MKSQFKKLLKAGKYHIMAWAVAIVLLTIYCIAAIRVNHLSLWHILIQQMGTILIAGSITIGLVQTGIFSVRKLMNGNKIWGGILLFVTIVCALLWICISQLVLMLDGGGGLEGIFICCLPYAIPLYYILKYGGKTMWVITVLAILPCLAYTYFTIELKGPMEFIITDRPVDIPGSWFNSYGFYRFGSIGIMTFIYTSLVSIILFAGRSILKYYRKEN